MAVIPAYRHSYSTLLVILIQTLSKAKSPGEAVVVVVVVVVVFVVVLVGRSLKYNSRLLLAFLY